MPNSHVENNKVEEDSNVKIVQTDEGNQNGQTKCPKCGATDISLDVQSGKLRCNFCRFTFENKKVEGIEEDASKLSGKTVASGAKDIDPNALDIITIKCSSCGAEVVIDTASVTQARCHWCRNTLSINQQIPNGAVPDIVLPFKLKKEEARKSIETFVHKRNFFALPKFKKEFTTENIMGVYFPYMVVDANAHALFEGEGEHLIRSYTVSTGDSSQTYYDADLYYVEREFDIAIDDLTVESSKDKLNNSSNSKTNNVINAIMPFDIENAVKWDANYLKGYTSEKRDVNVSDLSPLVKTQVVDISRFAANDSLSFYDRGVAWTKQEVDVKGSQWSAAYLPVWLYSYQQIKGSKHILHYVAVNARTNETMGSVPINMPRLLLISAIIEMFCFWLTVQVDSDVEWVFLTIGVAFYLIMYNRYRNKSARHRHELETKNKVDNLREVDNLLKRRNHLSNSKIVGMNNRSVNGSTIDKSNFTNLLDKVSDSKNIHIGIKK